MLLFALVNLLFIRSGRGQTRLKHRCERPSLSSGGKILLNLSNNEISIFARKAAAAATR